MAASDRMIMIRKARLPEDAEAIAKIDATLETPEIYRPVQDADGLHLRLTKVSPPFKKLYSLENYAVHAPPCDFNLVAVEGARLVGFVATTTQDWNRRCAVWHFYVDAAHRRRGIGRMLMDEVEAHTRKSGANHLWVETQNVNVPAITAYRALGFELCGMDLTLYRGTIEADEAAVFLARDLT